jgi:hypothetical protein
MQRQPEGRSLMSDGLLWKWSVAVESSGVNRHTVQTIKSKG